jgi:polyisoprenoid-binding protein YceI
MKRTAPEPRPASPFNPPGFITALLALCATPASLSAAPLAVDLAKSEIVFVSKQMGVPVEGRFRKFSVQLDFDAKKPETAKAALEVDISSIDAGSPEADGEVVRKPWFNAAQFPKATFGSTSIKPLGNNRYELTGPITIKGKTRNVTTPFTVKAAGATQVFEGTFILNRSEFGIGDGPWNDPETVALEVQVRFKFVTAPK